MNEVTRIEPPIQSEAASGRKTRRDSMLLSVEIERIENGKRFVARARNVSTGGMMADEQDGLVLGDRVAITMRGIGRIGGGVAWARNGRIGIAFDKPIDPSLTRRPVGAPKRADAPKTALFPPIKA